MTAYVNQSSTVEPLSARHRLGELLVDAGKLDAGALERALRLQREQRSSERIGAILVKLGLVSERDVAECLADQMGLDLVTKKDFPEELPADDQISAKFLRDRKALVLAEEPDHLVVVLADPTDTYALDALRLISGREILPRVGVPSEIELALEQHYGNDKAAGGPAIPGGNTADAGFEDDVRHLKELASEAPVIKYVNLLLNRAVEVGASDVHIEPFEHRLKVRYRVDGLLREVESAGVQSSAAVISRVKIMANLNIAERRLPQDGRFKIRVRGKEIDLRVSTVPTMHGESVVMRLLHRDEVVLNFTSLGFGPELRQAMLHVLSLPHGIVLVTGPTGSGKTTTLYAALRHLNTPERKILTVEDPVEYNLEGINQIQVKPQIGLSFANALRSIVRQDPDVVMIGEMRDQETAKIAVQSALTGHLVLSTLHTNDAVGSITRMLDMGVEDYLLSSTVNAVVGQRLVRTLCSHCREPYPALDEVVRKWRLDRFADPRGLVLHRAKGCEHCGGTGYAGRTTIVELLLMSDPLRELVLKHADAGEMARAAVAHGMHTMFEDGMGKVIAGQTTVEEVLRVTQDV